jgi:hypothetical protein
MIHHPPTPPFTILLAIGLGLVIWPLILPPLAGEGISITPIVVGVVIMGLAVWWSWLAYTRS